MSDLSFEISQEEFSALPENDRLLIDIRDQASISYGMIPGALHVPQENVPEWADSLLSGQAAKAHAGDAAAGNVFHASGAQTDTPKAFSKCIVLYCSRGIFSLELAAKLQERGQDGYNGWLLFSMKKEKELEAADDGEAYRLSRQQQIEDSIRRKFRRVLFSRFAKAVCEYQLVEPNDKIAVCISGGKDSMLMAKLFQELKRHNKFPFELVFLVMDPGYNRENRLIIEQNAHTLGIPVTIFETQIFEAVYNVDKSPCYLCARMRRGYLYKKAQELGCNKIALGHHYDDVIETNLMGMLYAGQIQTMMPKLHSIHFGGMELIRPMYLIREEDIIHWRDYNELRFIQCACRFTDTCTTCRPDGSSVSKRMEVKKMIAELKKTNPYVEGNIFRSMENVNIDTVIGYKQYGVRHSFLDNYEELGKVEFD